MPITADSLKAEAARIEQAYARRKKDHLYPGFTLPYLSRPSHVGWRLFLGSYAMS
jgi:hypothetical protein